MLNKSQLIDNLLKSLPKQSGVNPVDAELSVRLYANDVVTTDPLIYWVSVLGRLESEYPYRDGQEPLITIQNPYPNRDLTDNVASYWNVVLAPDAQGNIPEVKFGPSDDKAGSLFADAYININLKNRPDLVYDANITDGVEAGRYLPSDAYSYNSILSQHNLIPAIVEFEANARIRLFEIVSQTVSSDAFTKEFVVKYYVENYGTNPVPVFSCVDQYGADRSGDVTSIAAVIVGNDRVYEYQIDVELGYVYTISLSYNDDSITFPISSDENSLDYVQDLYGTDFQALVLSDPSYVNKVMSFNLYTDSWSYQASINGLSSQNGEARSTAPNSVSGNMTRNDGLEVKITLVSPSGCGDAVFKKSSDSNLAASVGSPSGVIIKDLELGNNIKIAQRSNLRLKNISLPEDFGYVSAFDTNRNYTSIYYMNNTEMILRMAGGVVSWNDLFPVSDGNGLVGGADEFGTGINGHQLKVGEGSSTAGQDDGQPNMFFYLTKDSDGDDAIQFRARTYDGNNFTLDFSNYIKITKNLAYVVLCAVKARGNTSPTPQARAYYWVITLADFNSLFSGQNQLPASASIPSPSFEGNFYPDGDPDDPSDTYKILGVYSLFNNYASAYANGSAVSQEYYNLKNGEPMRVVSNPYELHEDFVMPQGKYSIVSDYRLMFRTMANRLRQNLL